MFPSFVENPTNLRFQGQDEDEQIILFLRAHPITNLVWVIPALLLIALPALVPILTNLLNIDLSLFIPSFLNNIFLSINIILVAATVIMGFLGWVYNVNILTNKNLVDIDMTSLLSKKIDIVPLPSVEEATASSGGILHLFFSFGSVLVQTASERQQMDIRDVPHPEKAADIILDQAKKARLSEEGGGH